MSLAKLPTARDLSGNIITIADLPKVGERRWTPNKKAIVVSAVQNGLLTAEEAMQRYGMDEGEFKAWEEALQQQGGRGLRVTQLYWRRRRTL